MRVRLGVFSAFPKTWSIRPSSGATMSIIVTVSSFMSDQHQDEPLDELPPQLVGLRNLVMGMGVLMVAGIFILVGLLVWKIAAGSDSSVSNPWNNVELALPLDEEIVNMASHRRHVDILVRKADGHQELRRVHADGRVDILFKILPE